MRAALALLCCLTPAGCTSADAVPQDARIVTVIVDTGRVLHGINPEIYGVSFADAPTLRDLNLPLDRSGGNSATLYDWRGDARNAGSDFFFESLPVGDSITDQFSHGFVEQARRGGARPILTIPAIGWTARLGPGRAKLAGFSTRKYGSQQAADTQWFPEAGNGKHPDGTIITGNDPNDAARPVDIAAEARARVSDLVARWGRADRGGVPYYAVDNEPGLWHESQREVRSEGIHAADLSDRVLAVAAAIKQADPSARVLAPEAWGWPELFDSGFDVQGRGKGLAADRTDRTRQTGGMDQLPWLLERWRAAGHPIDVVSVHFYPQGGEYNDGAAGGREVQLRRNRSTRALWDESYRDESWIAERIALIPRLRRWVDRHYAPGTPIALTEYNWGGENSMSGATAQADLWGLFGRHGLDMAVRWATPAPETPTYKAMKLIRNPDGQGTAFGNRALAVSVPDPDTLSAFAALCDDRTLTLLVVNKALDQAANLRVILKGRKPGRRASARAFRLVENRLEPGERVALQGAELRDRLPPQSVALYLVPANAR